MRESLTDEQVLSMIHQVFPQAEPVALTRFPGRHQNSNYDLKIRNPTMEVAIKVYQNAADQRPWQEARLLQLLTSETGVPVPRVLYFDDSGDLLPEPWILYTRLPGRPLADVLGEMDEWALEAIGYEMGRYMARIHQIPLETFGDLFASEFEGSVFEHEKAFVLDLADRCLTTCVVAQAMPPAEADRIRHILETSTVLTQTQACLIHGDYTPDHIIVEFSITDYHVTGVLDLTHAQASALEHDMSRLFNRWFEERAPLQKGFLDGYTEAAEMQARFWDRLHIYRLVDYLEQAARLCAQKATQAECSEAIQRLERFTTRFAN